MESPNYSTYSRPVQNLVSYLPRNTNVMGSWPSSLTLKLPSCRSPGCPLQSQTSYLLACPFACETGRPANDEEPDSGTLKTTAKSLILNKFQTSVHATAFLFSCHLLLGHPWEEEAGGFSPSGPFKDPCVSCIWQEIGFHLQVSRSPEL